VRRCRYGKDSQTYASDVLQSVSCQKPSRLIDAQEFVPGAPLAQFQ
jgi:hypothetical protein